MQFVAKAKYIHHSPYKLRPLADVVRGKNVKFALDWLTTFPVRKSEPLKKVIASAAANAKNLHDLSSENLAIKEIRIDQGPIMRYFKAGAMGRANIQRKRFSHISVILEDLVK